MSNERQINQMAINLTKDRVRKTRNEKENPQRIYDIHYRIDHLKKKLKIILKLLQINLLPFK